MALLDSLADTSKPTCRTCRWWVPTHGQEFGECHFDSPQRVDYQASVWPTTSHDNFCSHWLLSSYVLPSA